MVPSILSVPRPYSQTATLDFWRNTFESVHKSQQLANTHVLEIPENKVLQGS